jgi:transcriptional antiterminator RfaH
VNSSVVNLSPPEAENSDSIQILTRAGGERPAAAARALGARWYVCYTCQHKEAKAEGELNKRGFETFLPCYRKQRKHARRVDTVSAPLFPRYVFVSFDTNTPWRAINSAPGISRLICNGDDTPVPVPFGIVEALKSRGVIKLDAPLHTGDKVRVVGGVFESFVGLFEGLDERERIAVLLDVLGRKVRVTLDANLVAAA